MIKEIVMATCKNCGKPLILSRGKCIYCGWDPNQGSKTGSVQDASRRSKPIIQRRAMGSREGQSPYSQYAGQSIIPGAKTDRFGNPQGSQYDLARDGAFKGYQVIMLCLFWNDNMECPKHAIEKKGFTVKIFKSEDIPVPRDLKALLDDDRSQLWIVSHDHCMLSQEHYNVVYDHFNKGRGVYVWSDNNPYYADSNIILANLFHSGMCRDYMADQVLSVQMENNKPGIIKNHPISTGIQNFYEGHSITCVKMAGDLKPLVYCSNGDIVTAYYDKARKRCLVDGGFTRLYLKWDSAGTDRFVVNCAAWLTNIERFGYHPDK